MLSADVVIVSRPDDSIAGRMRTALEKRGRRAECLDGPAAARLFTIRVGEETTLITPELPLFVRPSAWWSNETIDADERFLRSEAYAAFWAAAVLTPAPVINRPARNGACPRLTAGPIAHAIGWTPSNGAACPAYETHASGPEMIETADGFWGEDMRYLTAPLANLERGVPLRARKLDANAQYEIVTVVGDRAFPATTDRRTAELELGLRSAAIAQRFGFCFCAITWSVSGAEALPIRANPAPDEYEVRYAWSEISAALCEVLLA